ncbi:MAG: sensor histidine kinase [Oscillospiraceae bacterium]|nr:sensor histidine kinase [Oscillospiraceae bacterium]
MEKTTASPDLLEQLICPAFLVKDGVIIHANEAAVRRSVALQTQVCDIIKIGSKEYEQYTHGRLGLTLRICDTDYNAFVTVVDDAQLFCLESDYENPELRAYALAAQQLREPLSNAMAVTESLLPDDAVCKNEEVRLQLCQVNRSLHQLLRTICNMSDAAIYKNGNSDRKETRDITAVFNEILEKAAALAAKAGKTLEYETIYTPLLYPVDVQRLERAVLNLISNALRFSPVGSVIRANLRKSENRLVFSIENQIDNPIKNNIFSRYLREPGIETGNTGIGLGLSIIHSVASAHGGVVLMEVPDDTLVRFTMTVALKKSKNTVVRSPILLVTDYAGGRDNTLLELSDCLPDELYDSIC